MKRLISSIIIGISAVCIASAQELYTVEKCYELSETNYPLIKRYSLIDITEEYTLKNAYMHYLPQIQITGRAFWMPKESNVFTGPPTVYGADGEILNVMPRDQFNVGIEVSQVLWDGVEIAANRSHIRAEHAVLREQQNVNMYALKERINDLFFGILMIHMQLQQIDLLEHDLSVNLDRIKASIAGGVANLSDQDVITVEQLSAKQNRVKLESMCEAYLKMLSLMTGAEIVSPEQLIKPIPQEVNKREFLQNLMLADIRRPELALYDVQHLEIDTKHKYWIAGGLPKIRLFAQLGWGRGYNLFRPNPGMDLVAGVRLTWNISELYSLGYGKNIIASSKEQIETVRETFLYNTSLQSQEMIATINRYFRIMEDDDELIRLREKIRKSAEVAVENGAMSASELVRIRNQEELAKQDKILHEIELMKSLYGLKTIKNN